MSSSSITVRRGRSRAGAFRAGTVFGAAAFGDAAFGDAAFGGAAFGDAERAGGAAARAGLFRAADFFAATRAGWVRLREADFDVVFRAAAFFFAPVRAVRAPPRAVLRADDLDRLPPAAFRLAAPVLRLAIAVILSTGLNPELRTPNPEPANPELNREPRPGTRNLEPGTESSVTLTVSDKFRKL
jgi:hypothetical protein